MIKPLSPMRPVLSSAEVRAHLRNLDTEESGLIDAYLLASQSDIEIQCERSLVMRKFRLILPRFPSRDNGKIGPQPFADDDSDLRIDGSAILLEMVPVGFIESISYYDRDNALQSYEDWNLFSDAEPAELRQVLDTSWPTTYSRRDAVTITFWSGHVIPLALDAGNDQFISLTGYPFVNGQEITISKSGNSNPEAGDVAVLPTGLDSFTTYHVRDVSGNRFKIAASSGGDALSLAEPTTDGEAIDLLFAGELDPYHRLALLQMTAKAFGDRCPQGGCVCSKEDFETNPMLRRLKWRSVAEFMG